MKRLDPKQPVAALLWVGLVTLTFFAIKLQDPPAPVAATASPMEFSAERAFKHVEAIAKAPRPIGSAEHAVARDYILEQLRVVGLEPQTQKTTAIDSAQAPSFLAGAVENVMARAKGSGNGRALLLVAHYDSVPTGPGANDDAVGVATLLETARALAASGSRLRNDVIFLFTDGEETGLLGARAFVAEHPWAKDVGVVLNFEARGKGGQAVMFETSPGNGKLIEALTRAARYPVCNSLSYEVYKRLPNDTDLSVFKAAGWQGMNFAYIDGLTHYHTQLDNLASVDARSLQHQGSYALALSRYLGDAVLGAKREGDSIYFNVIGFVIARYPARLALPLAIVVVLILAAVVLIGIRRGTLTFNGIGVGALVFLISLLASPAVIAGAWWIVLRIHPQYAHIAEGDTYHHGLYVLGFAAFSLATSAAILGSFRPRVSAQNLLVGALLWWVVLMIITAVCVVGVSFLFTWPLLFATAGFGFANIFRKGNHDSVTNLIVASFCAIPGVLLIAPAANLIFIALPFALAPAVAVLLVLLCGPLIPLLRVHFFGRRWLFPVVIAAGGLGFFVVAGMRSNFDDDHRQTNHMLYVLNASTQRAVWASADAALDKWTAQFLDGKSNARPLAEPFMLSRKLFLQNEAALAPLAAPEARVVDDVTANGIRRLRIHLSSPRAAPRISLQTDAAILSASVEGKILTAKAGAARGGKNWGLLYLAPPAEGIDLLLETPPSSSLTVQVMDESYGLPEVPAFKFTARPADMMPAPYFRSDFTLVTRNYTF